MSYLATVLADNPSHFWRLADPPGTAVLFDLIAAGRHGIFANVAYAATGYTGPASDGGSMYFNSFSPDTRLHHAITLTPPFSVDCWGWAMSDAGVLMSLFGHNTLLIVLNAALQPAFRSNAVLSASAVAVTDETWHHYAIVVTALGYTGYVDGAVVVGPIADPTAALLGKMQLGNGTAAGTPWGGYIAELASYPAALTGVRVAAHFAAGDSATNVPVLGTFSGNPGTGPNAGNLSAGVSLSDLRKAVYRTFTD